MILVKDVACQVSVFSSATGWGCYMQHATITTPIHCRTARGPGGPPSRSHHWPPLNATSGLVAFTTAGGNGTDHDIGAEPVPSTSRAWNSPDVAGNRDWISCCLSGCASAHIMVGILAAHSCLQAASEQALSAETLLAAAKPGPAPPNPALNIQS
jgi:hypothetical protein